jgi:hypothetical protein
MIPPAPISPRPARATIQIGRPVKGSVPPGGDVEVDLDGTAVVDLVDVGFPWATSVTLNAARKVGAVVAADVNGGSVLLLDTAGSAVAAVVEDGAVVGVLDAACPPIVVSAGVDAAVEVMVVPDGAVVVDADVVVPVDLEVDVVDTTSAGAVVV